MNTSQTVAVVDDDEASRIAIATLIRSLGWNVRTFESAEEFLQSGKADRTSCLISDVRMGGMSGVAMHAHLLSQGYAPPTIFISAALTPALHAEVMANGALALLEKPVTPCDVVHWVALAANQQQLPTDPD